MQPSSQSVCAGTPVTFTVGATGTGLQYQWRKNGINIVGATTASYNISSVSASDAADYDVMVTGECGIQTSSTATLSLNGVLLITEHPASKTVCAGSAVTFSVAVSASGLTYQWRKEGIAIAGATASAYTIKGATVAHQGNYDVVVTSTCSPIATSNNAVLTIKPPVEITDQPIEKVVCAGDQVTLSVTTTNGSNPSYQWRKDGAIINGAIGTTFTIPSASTMDAGNYDVVITTTCNTVTSSIAPVTVKAVPATPIITATTPTVFCDGNKVELHSSTANGNQWFKNGVGIEGATEPILTVKAAGDYTVIAKQEGCTSLAAAIQRVEVRSIPLKPVIIFNADQLFSSATAGNQWYFNGTAIAGAIANTFKPLLSGVYSVKVNVDGCESEMSDVFNYVSTAVNSPELEPYLIIAPNPVKETLLIKYQGAPAKLTATLLDISGRKMSATSIFTNKYNLSMMHLAKGIYIVVITNERTGYRTQKSIIKQ
ncbi:hypothetical protein SY85_19995 [Flavisolibacter tropicus]|uniref:Ig-like domain-containing protein n=2 Tax=Flavisolibacter tropicus TaxID=1492898 RepID=A0A172TZL5_9BACT|nr:hypothetical protein SY85_19995 [Flavisolibacter tropicus]